MKNLIIEKLDDSLTNIFLELQKQEHITSGDIDPWDSHRLSVSVEELANVIKDVIEWQKLHCSEDGLREKAIKMLNDNDELFDRLAFCCTSCICDVHLYPMESLDDYFEFDATPTEIINALRWFDTNDDFFYEEDGMLYSITDTVKLFSKHFTAEDILDRAIEELDADLQMDDEFDEVFRALKKHSEQ